jgi:hypothetical protein
VTPKYGPKRLAAEPDSGGQFSDTETQLDEENPAISQHFEREPIPYALEIDWPPGAAGFEPLHLRIAMHEDSPPGGSGLELAHLEIASAQAAFWRQVQ